MRAKVGFHDFLNSKPILYAMRQGLVKTPFELVIDTPANLATMFHEKRLDIALIPSVEYGRSADAVIIPTLCIASVGKVESVLLFTEGDIEKMETVCVDPKSRTSVTALKILLKEFYQKEPEIIVGDGDPETMLKTADGALLIGDLAYDIDKNRYVAHDLGEMWYRYSGLPFVHALLCCHKGERWDDAIESIAQAKDIGLKNRELIASHEGGSSARTGKLLDYLSERIHYDFGEEEKTGLIKFLTAAHEMGLVKRTYLDLYKD
ncbi:Menaquinone via futalosine step 1 [hydrothermal vent metagenome]|uniref:Menaquinone via futalosine step 1 n=1 Tax=hydrothermal vent metagenome TaxID=652676 RepID=A0A3B1CJ78_9ZZZZ